MAADEVLRNMSRDKLATVFADEERNYLDDDKANNMLQALVLVQFLNGDPTVISPGSLRYISSTKPERKDGTCTTESTTKKSVIPKLA